MAESLAESLATESTTVLSGDEKSAGHVTYRPRPNRPPRSNDTNSPFASPTRNITSPPRLHRRDDAASTYSAAIRHAQEIYEKDVDPKVKSEGSEGFHTWLASEITNVLGSAAGVTLSTTGKLVAPPLQLTKNILLPGLWAWIVDTLETITPTKVQDWFRILSSSVYHLMIVLGNTERGQLFSSQFYVVLQDLVHVLSAPESRQVLIDGMVTFVKFAHAMNTPEVQEWLEHYSILGVRCMDAASSGNAKQLLQDWKDLIWNGIELATDPTTTVALAEVTAHLCHALEDAHQAKVGSAQQSNQTPKQQQATRRTLRNAQNQAVYLNSYHMSDFPDQVSMEQVILSCLGIPRSEVGTDELGETKEGEPAPADSAQQAAFGGASIRSKVAPGEDDMSTAADPSNAPKNWRERGEQVDVKLLREKILQDAQPRHHHPDLALPSFSDEKANSSGTQSDIEVLSPPVDRELLDMEDIAWSKVPGSKRQTVDATKKPAEPVDISAAVEQFHSKLDELLEKNRSRYKKNESDAEKDAPLTGVSLGGPRALGRSGLNQIKHSRGKLRSVATSNLTKNPNLAKAIAGLIVLFLSLFSGFACYGMYTFSRQMFFGSTQRMTNPITQPSMVPKGSEVVIRIVREVVHVTEDGTVLSKSQGEALTDAEIERISESVARGMEL